MINVVAVQYVRPFVLRLRFTDGLEGEIDLANELDGPVFAPLREPAYFATVAVNPDLRTIAWPNGADFAPEFLHERVRAHAAA